MLICLEVSTLELSQMIALDSNDRLEKGRDEM